MATAMRRVPAKTAVLVHSDDQTVSSKLDTDAFRITSGAYLRVNRAGRQYSVKAVRVAI